MQWLITDIIFAMTNDFITHWNFYEMNLDKEELNVSEGVRHSRIAVCYRKPYYYYFPFAEVHDIIPLTRSMELIRH